VSIVAEVSGHDPVLYYAGDPALLLKPCVAVVGSRKATQDGQRRAARLATELAHAGVVVVSGLAEGIDTAAHTAAMAAGGRTIAVIGTPLSKAYPAANAKLQERIWAEHLLISPFAAGSKVYPSNFPMRNRVMAALTDATVIVEASNTSGALHQAAECARLGRWLFIAKNQTERSDLEWPTAFLRGSAPGGRVRVLESTSDVLAVLVK
jgi:DNA processing protein